MSPTRNADNSKPPAPLDNEEATLVAVRSERGVERETTGIDDDTTTGQDARQHRVVAIETEERPRTITLRSSPVDDGGASRAWRSTLRSADAPRRRSRWLGWVVVLACLAAGAVVLGRAQLLGNKAPAPAASPVSQSAPPETSSKDARSSKLWLEVHVQPEDARVELDGTMIDADKPLELELACPNGSHQLRIEARDHEAMVKRIPCSGRVVVDLALVER